MTLEELREWGRANRDWLNAVTAGLIVGTIIVWLAWDGFVGLSGADTESQMLTRWSTWCLFLPYGVASLLGHWWWPWRSQKSPYIAWRGYLNFAVLGALGVWDLLNWKLGTPSWLMWARHVELWCAIGYPMGHLCWGQRSTEPKTEGASGA